MQVMYNKCRHDSISLSPENQCGYIMSCVSRPAVGPSGGEPQLIVDYQVKGTVHTVVRE